MDLIYWITRFDAVHGMFLGFMVTAIFGVIVFIITKICSFSSYDKDDREICRKIAKGCRCFIAILPISVLGLIFTPTTNEALVIFGVGETIEWVKSNDKVKQLPDKAVEALSLYLDNINEEQRNKETKKNKSEFIKLEE